MINNIFIFIAALFMVIRGATLATKYAGRLAESYGLTKYAVGFLVVAIISILPETFVAVQAAIKGMPAFGLGTLFGSNIADLTLIFALIVLISGRSLKVESKILASHAAYPFMLIIPLILGFNGHYSRLEGLALILTGAVFYYRALREGANMDGATATRVNKLKETGMLLFSMIVLLVGAHFTVTSASTLAAYAGVSPVLIGMLIVGLGTTMPEFFFALKTVRHNEDSLAIGDLLGTVLADATIVVGILATISPFAFSQRIVFLTGLFMVVSAFILFYFMRTGRRLTKKEALLLLYLWVAFVLLEFIAST